MKTTRILKAVALASVPLVAACGDSDADYGERIATVDTTYSAVAMTLAELPECDEDREGQLIYVQDVSAFRYCSAESWAEIEVKGEKGDAGEAGAIGETGETGAVGAAGAAGNPGISLAGRWKYHLDTYVGATDLYETTTSAYDVYLGDVRLAVFSDGSAFVSASGYVWDYYSSDNYSSTDWTFAQFIPASSTEVTLTSKLDSYTNERVSMKVLSSATAPTFKITVDDDGSLSDNTYTSFTLTQE